MVTARSSPHLSDDSAEELVVLGKLTEVVSRVRHHRALDAAVGCSQAKLEGEHHPIVAAPRYDSVTGNLTMQRLGGGVNVSLRQPASNPATRRSSPAAATLPNMHRPGPPRR